MRDALLAHSRSLLDHCWDDRAHSVTEGSSGGDWMRIIAWIVNLLIATAFLVLCVKKWPPPPRVFPRRKPLCGIPWCITARLLGYGLFDWRTGKLTPWWDYIKEKHEIVNIFAGDAGFITQRARFLHLATELACTAAVSMVLTDLTSAKVTGAFWTKQLWVFVLLLAYDIVLSVALRLATLGATKASFEAAEMVGFECAESGQLENLEDEEQLIEMGIKASKAFKAIQNAMLKYCVAFAMASLMICGMWAHLANPADGCGTAFQTFLAYAYIFGLYQGFSLIVVAPMMLTSRWLIGFFLITRIPEVETREETMDCCWSHIFPKLCACKPPEVTPLELKTVNDLFWSPRKDDGVDTGNLAKAAAVAAAGKSRYSAQESPITPVPAMKRDIESGDKSVSFSPGSFDAWVPEDSPASTEVAPSPLESSPSIKFAALRRQASMKYDISDELIDSEHFPQGNVERAHYDARDRETFDPVSASSEAAFAAARMALMGAGKLTPEQILRTRSFKAHMANVRYSQSASSDDERVRQHDATASDAEFSEDTHSKEGDEEDPWEDPQIDPKQNRVE